MIKIAYIDISQINHKELDMLKKRVSEQCRNRSEKYLKFYDSVRCIMSYVLTEYIVKEVYGKDAAIEIVYNRYGKPALKNYPDIKYNITHSGEWVIIAYNNKDIGIDIEKIRPVTIKIAKYFTDSEKEYLYSKHGDENENIIRLWTIKESYLKFLGKGLSQSLKSFSVDLEKNRIIIDNKESPDVVLQSIAFENNFFLAICTEEKNSIIMEEINIHDILNGIYSEYSQEF